MNKEAEKFRERIIAAAKQGDADLRHLAHGEAALGYALGRTLAKLFADGKLADLSYAREKDYLVERIGIPARTGFLFLRVARVVSGRELIARAILCGAVSLEKALAIARVAKGDQEGRWVGLAMVLKLTELVERVEAAGSEALTDDYEADRINLAMTPTDRILQDFAMKAAREQVGLAAPRWQCQEAIAMEWLSGHPEWTPEEEKKVEEALAGPPGGAPTVPPDEQWARTRATVEKELRVLEEAWHIAECEDDPFCVAAAALDKRARRLNIVREKLTEPFGRMLRAYKLSGLWAYLGYRSFDEYARDRLDLAPRTIRQRLWLERKLDEMPPLREALRKGTVTLAKALHIAKHATAADVEDRIDAAKDKPAEKVERETVAEEDRRDAASGVTRMWGPKEAMDTVRRSIVSAQAWARARGEEIDESRALGLTYAYYLGEFQQHRRGRKPPRIRMTVFARKDGLCQVPGCTNAVHHLHHIVYRSNQGGDEVTNLCGVCKFHHGMIHHHFLRVWGLAGDRLVFEFGGVKDPFETWVTENDDDTVRVRPRTSGKAARAGAGPDQVSETGAGAGAGADRVSDADVAAGADRVSESGAVWGSARVVAVG